MPAVLARVEAELEANPIPNQRVDRSVLHIYAWMVAQAELHMEWFDLNGGPLTDEGNYKKGWIGLMQSVDRIEKYARLNGIGALARAQTAQLTANANLSQAEVLAARARLRERQSRLQGAPTPALPPPGSLD